MSRGLHPDTVRQIVRFELAESERRAETAAAKTERRSTRFGWIMFLLGAALTLGTFGYSELHHDPVEHPRAQVCDASPTKEILSLAETARGRLILQTMGLPGVTARSSCDRALERAFEAYDRDTQLLLVKGDDPQTAGH